MKLSRVERKLLAAILAVAVTSMVGALVLGQRALSEAYDVGVNPRVQAQLEQGLEVHRAHLLALRRNADQAADAVVFDHALHVAAVAGDAPALRQRLQRLLTHYPALVRLRAQRTGPAPLSLEVAATDSPVGMRLLQLERELALSGGPLKLQITAATPDAAFRQYQQAGRLVETYGRLRAGSDKLTRFYLLVYMALLLTVIAVALWLGIVIARRVTRRVAILAAATQRVGAGDLEVQVPSQVDDEVGELTRDFNAMVRDLRGSRTRIDYLQRIGAWQQFARRLAHEIKNPLTPIQLAVQELHTSYTGDDEAFGRRLKEAHGIITEEVATLRRLVGEFSTFAKLPEAQLEPADMSTFLGDTARSLEAIAEEYRTGDMQAQVMVESGDEPLPCRIDAMMLKRALDNLVRNALQAIRDQQGDTAAAEISVRSWREGDLIMLSVQDNGPGIREEDQGRVFDPYFTTKSDGTGLGLAIVKKVVLEHNGEIQVQRGDEGGARFLVQLARIGP